MAGALLLPLCVFTVWERVTLLPDEAVWHALPLLPTAFSIPIGAFIGCLLGFCLWIACTPRPVHPLHVSLAFGILSFVVCLPIHFVFFDIFDPVRGDGGGLGPNMRAVGIGQTYLYRTIDGTYNAF